MFDPTELLWVTLFVGGVGALLLATGLAWLRFLRERRRAGPAHDEKMRSTAVCRWVLTGATVAGLGCFAWGWLVEPAFPRTTWIELSVRNLIGPMRLVQLSDLHLDGEAQTLERALSLVERAAPDLIVLTGDYLNDDRFGPDLDGLARRLVEIAGDGAVFAVSGNFDGSPGDGGPIDILMRAGVQVLDGTGVTFTRRDAALQVFGMRHTFDYALADDGLRELAAQVAPGVPAILLYHEPSLALSPGSEAFALQLSGHTHGGQVRLPWVGALLTLSRHGRRFQAGLYSLGDGRFLYVHRGLGMEPLPLLRVRFLCPPEVAVFDLVPEAPN
jgi:predicted MPP superfamily phosphohydrolase